MKTFSPIWLPIRTMSLASSKSTGSGELETLPEGEGIADFARAAALRERRLGTVGRAVRFHQRTEERRGNAVRKERHAFRARASVS